VGRNLSQGDDLVEDDELDVVVGFLDDELDVGGGGRLDGGRSRREGDKGTRSFVFDGGRGGVEKRVDAADEAGALGRVGMANLLRNRTRIKL